MLASLPALAADLAVLRNGFSIRHERREVQGATTRLYLATNDSGYVDVPNEQIDHFEQDLTPLKRWGQPEDIAAAVVAIAKGLLPFSTGEVINVDGGFHLRRL